MSGRPRDERSEHEAPFEAAAEPTPRPGAVAPRQRRSELEALRIDRSLRAGARRSKPRRWLRPLALAVVLVAGAAAAFHFVTGATVPVEVAPASVLAPGASLTGPILAGSGYVVTGDKYISVGVKVPGRIERYLVDEGQPVRAGDALVELDSRDYRAQLDRARATLALSRAQANLKRKNLERSRALRKSGVVSTQDLDVAEAESATAQAAIGQAEADVAAAEVAVEYCTLRAPLDGVVLEKKKEVGEIAVPGGFQGAGDLVRMANLSDLRAEVDINEIDFGKVTMGQAAEVVPDAYPDRKYRASVVKIYPQANRQKGTFKVEVKIADADSVLRPDMTVRITFLASLGKGGAADETRPRVLAPRAAVRGGEGAHYVWVVKEDRAHRVEVVAGDALGERVEITRGLEGGEALVVSSEEKLRDDVKVSRR
jgi:RND family efflux transporter MFP subunit